MLLPENPKSINLDLLASQCDLDRILAVLDGCGGAGGCRCWAPGTWWFLFPWVARRRLPCRRRASTRRRCNSKTRVAPRACGGRGSIQGIVEIAEPTEARLLENSWTNPESSILLLQNSGKYWQCHARNAVILETCTGLSHTACLALPRQVGPRMAVGADGTSVLATAATIASWMAASMKKARLPWCSCQCRPTGSLTWCDSDRSHMSLTAKRLAKCISARPLTPKALSAMATRVYRWLPPNEWTVSYMATMFSVGVTDWRLWQGPQIQRAPS